MFWLGRGVGAAAEESKKTGNSGLLSLFFSNILFGKFIEEIKMDYFKNFKLHKYCCFKER